MCQGKKRFAFRSQAKRSCTTIRRYSKGERMHAYFCALCRGWHIGHATEGGEEGTRMSRRRAGLPDAGEEE